MVLLKYFNAGTLSTLSNVLACSRRSDRGDGLFPFRERPLPFFKVDATIGNPPGGGGYLRNFWVGMCRWDAGTLNLCQS